MSRDNNELQLLRSFLALARETIDAAADAGQISGDSVGLLEDLSTLGNKLHTLYEQCRVETPIPKGFSPSDVEQRVLHLFGKCNAILGRISQHRRDQTGERRGVDAGAEIRSKWASLAEIQIGDMRDMADQAHYELAAVLQRLELEASPIVPLQGMPDGQSDLPAVSKHGKLILAALLRKPRVLMSVEDISSVLSDKLQTHLSEKTIGAELTKLIQADLAVRPEGKRRGATLTTTGKELAHKLAASR